MTWQAWERLQPFVAKHGKRVHFVYALGAHGSTGEGGTIYAHDAEVPLDDIERPPGRRHQIGSLTWNQRVIQNVGVGVVVNDEWPNKGIAREMLRLAREKEPSLRHAHCRDRTSNSGEAFVRATDPDQACNNECGEGCRKRGPKEPPIETVRPSGSWARVKGFFGR